MTNERRKQIIDAAKAWADDEYGDNGSYEVDNAFIKGALWADSNPNEIIEEMAEALREVYNHQECFGTEIGCLVLDAFMKYKKLKGTSG